MQHRLSSLFPFSHSDTAKTGTQSDTSPMLVDCFQDDNLVFILHVLCKNHLLLERLFDMFFTLRTNENGILKKKKMKAEQRSQKHDTERSGTYLHCKWLKELSNLTTSFLLRRNCHKKSLHFQRHSTQFSPLSVRPAAEGYWIFAPSQTQRFLCEQCWTEKGLESEWT